MERKYLSTNYCFLLSVLTFVMFALNIFIGSIRIPFADVCNILTGHGSDNSSWNYIIIQSRVPEAVTALLCGSALSVSGLMLQTAFRNPLAGPSLFGIDSGAALGVALVILFMGGNFSLSSYGMMGYSAVLVAAFAGAMSVTIMIFLFSSIVRSNVLLLIIGIMIGYVTSSAITIINFCSTAEGVKSFMIWGMGNFSSVSLVHLPIFCCIVIFGLAATICVIKPLNALLIGERYAESLGVDIRRLRHILMLITGILVSTTTAFCGPIAFIGLAVPHIVRLIYTSENHRKLLPATILTGASIALICNLASTLPNENGVVPINALTPIIGAPVIIYVIVKNK